MRRQGKITPWEAIHRLLFAIIAAFYSRRVVLLLVLTPSVKSTVQDMLDDLTPSQESTTKS